jgi:hypothetical protein
MQYKPLTRQPHRWEKLVDDVDQDVVLVINRAFGACHPYVELSNGGEKIGKGRRAVYRTKCEIPSNATTALLPQRGWGWVGT